MTIGEEIKRLRKLNGLTLADVSKHANVTKAYISMLENGKKENPSAVILSRLAKALDTSKLHLYKVAGYLDDTDTLELVDENKKLKQAFENLRNRAMNVSPDREEDGSIIEDTESKFLYEFCEAVLNGNESSDGQEVNHERK